MLTFNRLTGICHTYSCIGRGFAGTPATEFLLRSKSCSLCKPSVWLPILCRRMLCCVDVVMEMSAIPKLLYQAARVVHGILGIDVQENAPATTLLVSADCGIIKSFDRYMKVLLWSVTHRVGCSGQFRDLGVTPEPGPLPSL